MLGSGFQDSGNYEPSSTKNYNTPPQPGDIWWALLGCVLGTIIGVMIVECLSK